MLLYGTLALCAITVALLVYRYDLYDREPVVMLLLAALLGAGAMHLAGRVQVFGLLRLGEDAIANHWVVSTLAGTLEELAKLLVVLIFAGFLRRFFNDPIDGLIYGSFAGLGCAVEESIGVLDRLEPGEGLPPQEVVRQLGHMVMGGIGGFGVGRLHRRSGSSPYPRERGAAGVIGMIAGCYAVAVALHFAWDVVALPANDSGAMTTRQRAIAVATMVAGLAVYGWMVGVGSRRSALVFGGERPRGLWGWPFTGRAATR
ncbi:MAG: PrsW family glutamic-type intramembrane protease [Phycisphaerales bacterium]